MRYLDSRPFPLENHQENTFWIILFLFVLFVFILFFFCSTIPEWDSTWKPPTDRPPFPHRSIRSQLLKQTSRIKADHGLVQRDPRSSLLFLLLFRCKVNIDA